MEDKYSYYVKKFTEEGITEEILKEFKEDRSCCPYSTMPCQVCSCGCFKISVIHTIPEVFEKFIEP